MQGTQAVTFEGNVSATLQAVLEGSMFQMTAKAGTAGVANNPQVRVSPRMATPSGKKTSVSIDLQSPKSHGSLGDCPPITELSGANQGVYRAL
jgi:hypothetical protein